MARQNVVSKMIGAIIRIFVAVEDIIFDLVIRPVLLALYGIVKDSQWVEILDRLFELISESWPPSWPPDQEAKKEKKK